MQIVEQTAIIEAPMATVIEAIDDVENIPEWATVPGNIDNVQGRGVGMTYEWRFQVGNLAFKGQAEVIEQTGNTLISKTTGDVHSIWTATLTPISRQSTLLRVTVEYNLPNKFVEPLADIVVQRLATPEVANENMNRFKHRVEERARLRAKQEAIAQDH